jgi:hypothetical protein
LAQHLREKVLPIVVQLAVGDAKASLLYSIALQRSTAYQAHAFFAIQ